MVTKYRDFASYLVFHPCKFQAVTEPVDLSLVSQTRSAHAAAREPGTATA